MAKSQVSDREDILEEIAVLCNIGRHNNFLDNSNRRFHGFHNFPDNRHSRIQNHIHPIGNINTDIG